MLMMLVGTLTTGYAAEGESNITYTVNGSESYELKVKVEGNGTVFDGDAAIKNKISVYQLPIDESKSFKIVADEENTLKSITLNGTDITTAIKDKVIKVEGQAYAQELIITFQSKQDGGVLTGDTTKRGILILGMLGAGSMIFLFMKKKRKEQAVNYEED